MPWSLTLPARLVGHAVKQIECLEQCAKQLRAMERFGVDVTTEDGHQQISGTSFATLDAVESEALRELISIQRRLPEGQKVTQGRSTDTLQARGWIERNRETVQRLVEASIQDVLRKSAAYGPESSSLVPVRLGGVRSLLKELHITVDKMSGHLGHSSQHASAQMNEVSLRCN